MAENPFDSFFTGLIGGATAGARRRTLMERGQQGAGMAEEFFGGGPVTPPKAPGMGATFLAGLQLARTLPTTPSQQLQADQLKLQTAKFALEKSLDERKQAALELKTFADLELANKEAEDEKNDTFLFTVKQNEARKAFLTGGMSEVYKLDIPKFTSAEFTKDYTDFIKQLEATDLADRINQFQDVRSTLSALGVPEDQIPTELAAAKDMRDQKLGIREAERKREAAEKTIEMAKERRATSVTVQLGEGNQFTFNPTPTETADAYTKNQLANKILEVNNQLAKAQGADVRDEQAINTIGDSLDMLTGLAETKGWTDIVPGYRPPTQPPGQDVQGLDDWLGFQETLKSFVTPTR